MIEITFNAFNFVREKLKKQNIPYLNAKLNIPEDTTPKMLMRKYNLTDTDVEFVFINGKVHPKETLLKNGDRIAFVPPGTPGSYRLILGAKKARED
ncbi:MAG TPA: thiamine biosynthesis protein ThiS [Sulfurospirillum sp. UBA11407]|jgi:molybdopterin converting factor small subunit|nr:MAG TPA: thiamine biosynthesis protein ThiS [Sulfurospirillum sp. UBA11407]DAB34242.1 MAG TPA: thiamine biosynthesis protein ThiS [Sulfurospirillum sp. UBA12182]